MLVGLLPISWATRNVRPRRGGTAGQNDQQTESKSHGTKHPAIVRMCRGSSRCFPACFPVWRGCPSRISGITAKPSLALRRAVRRANRSQTALGYGRLRHTHRWSRDGGRDTTGNARMPAVNKFSKKHFAFVRGRA